MSPPSPPSPNTWNLRLGYRFVAGPQIGHGLQLAISPTVRFSDSFRLVPTTEINLMPGWSGVRGDSVTPATAGAAVGSPPRAVDGVAYTDITGGSRARERLHHYQVVQYLTFIWRPFPDVPFEMGVRFALGFENVADRTTVTALSDPSRYGREHRGPDGCVPGDVHCARGTVPEPGAWEGYPPGVAEDEHWNLFMRGGFRVNFPFHQVIRLGAELLFQANTHNPSGPDPFLRFPLTLTAPLLPHFQLQAEPRLIVRFQEPTVTFDMVAGALAVF